MFTYQNGPSAYQKGRDQVTGLRSQVSGLGRQGLIRRERTLPPAWGCELRAASYELRASRNWIFS
jgi:hypothetical protein